VERIIVGVDGSEGAKRALEWAVTEARAHGAVVEALSSWQASYSEVPIGVDVITLIEKAAERTLASAVEEVDAEGVEIRQNLVCGPPAPSLIDESKSADLLVVGSRGRGGFAGLLLGSVSHHVISHAACPVVIVPAAD